MARTTLVVAVMVATAGCTGGSADIELPELEEGAVRVSDAVDATGPVAVQGNLFATPTRDDGGSSGDGWRVELCEYLGYGDQPDVPMTLCLGDSVVVVGDAVDPFDLDLGWREENGFEQSSPVVVVTGEMDDGRLRVTRVERRGELVATVRSDDPPGPSG